nr:LytTR family DNA-binding domain-containing protein [Sedimentibacter sp.]
MIKIGIYNRRTDKKIKISDFVHKYFEDKKIDAKVSIIKTKLNILSEMLGLKSKYKIILLCENDLVICVKKYVILPNEKGTAVYVKKYKFPLCEEDMDDIVSSSISQDMECPYGIYQLSTDKVIAPIKFNDISYFQWEDNKTMLYLKNGEIYEIKESIKSIKKSLPQDFFFDGLKGYLINLYNVKLIDLFGHYYVMQSGGKITIPKNVSKKTERQFVRILFDL